MLSIFVDLPSEKPRKRQSQDGNFSASLRPSPADVADKLQQVNAREDKTLAALADVWPVISDESRETICGMVEQATDESVDSVDAIRRHWARVPPSTRVAIAGMTGAALSQSRKINPQTFDASPAIIGPFIPLKII